MHFSISLYTTYQSFIICYCFSNAKWALSIVSICGITGPIQLETNFSCVSPQIHAFCKSNNELTTSSTDLSLFACIRTVSVETIRQDVFCLFTRAIFDLGALWLLDARQRGNLAQVVTCGSYRLILSLLGDL